MTLAERDNLLIAVDRLTNELMQDPRSLEEIYNLEGEVVKDDNADSGKNTQHCQP